MDLSDVDDKSPNTASKSDLQATIAKLKYHANPDTNKKGSAVDQQNAKDLLAHYKKSRLPVPAPILCKSSRGMVSKACQKGYM